VSTEPTWRAYLAEWLTVYTSDGLGADGLRECKEHFDRKYAGRVAEIGRIVDPGPARLEPQRKCLQTRLWNLKGEFKDEADAVLMLGQHAGLEESPRVVQRGSAEEKSLLEYGKKMLPGAG
jgi:hypothetical protein